jgi:putative membrane protein
MAGRADALIGGGGLMGYLTQWSFDPFVVVCAGIVLAHERGLARLARRSQPERTRARRRRAFLFYAGLALLLLTVTSPLDYWTSDYFFVHMIEHIVIMFFVPILLVAGAPWLPLIHALPVTLRRRVGRALLLSRRAALLRALGRLLTNGVFAVVLYNVVMCVWHVPAAFDAAETNQVVHIWLMHGSFLVSGMLFWLQVIPSYPIRPRLSWTGRLAAIFVTDVVMFVLAMALGIFTSHSLYSVYEHVPGVSLSPVADQQIGAAILWVCGDFWALPSFIWALRRAIEEHGSASALLEAVLRRSASEPIGQAPGA